MQSTKTRKREKNLTKKKKLTRFDLARKMLYALYLAIKNTGFKESCIICDLFNQCVKLNVFPKAWKEAKVRMLPKPGRDKFQACNYRPISLLSCLGKTYERHIYSHLMLELKDLNYMNKNQAGFMKGRSAQEHIFKLAQDVSNGFKKRQCALALLVDVKAAFDAVWLAGLKHTIRKMGLSKQMKISFSHF